MAIDKAITDLPVATEIGDEDYLVLQQNNVAKSVRGAIVKKYAGDVFNDAKDALLALLSKVAYIDENGQEYLDELEAALMRKNVLSITAVFDQGSAVIYDTDSLDTLKQYLTVTANYDDGTSNTVTTYTLSGTLAVGTSTITVEYGDKTTTFDVTVSTHLLYSLENRNFSNESIDTGLALLDEDRDFSIAVDITLTSNPTSGTGSTMRLAAVVTADGSGYTLSFGKGNATANNYATVWCGQFKSMSATGTGHIRFVLTHTKASNQMGAISRKDLATPVSDTVSAQFQSSTRTLKFGVGTAANALAAGTINKAYVYDTVMTTEQINTFLGL